MSPILSHMPPIGTDHVVGNVSAMSFSTGSLRGATGLRAGVVDHRLARRALINEYRRGRLSRHQVCDAHPELMRAARAVGNETETDCPICAEDKLVLITYVFGPRLPKNGKVAQTTAELAAFHRRSEEFAAYVVEACPTCSWHHLLRVLPLGGGRGRRSRRDDAAAQ
jgi:hypothetical protein